jgi:dienelactone hydrolase
MRLLLTLVACGLLAGCSAAPAPDQLPGTSPLVGSGSEIATEMIDSMHRFLDRKLEQSAEWRKQNFKPDTSSPQAYTKSLEFYRAKLAAMLGVTDPRVPFEAPQLVATTTQPALIGKNKRMEAYTVRWPVLEDVWAEGILLQPVGKPVVADVIALSDTRNSPEVFSGLIVCNPSMVLHFAEGGCRVLVPTLVDRSTDFSQPPSGQKTMQPHREYVYRPAFQMRRHILSYEVQTILAAVDWMARERAERPRKIGVYGVGEGGLLALYAGAIDPRIDAVGVVSHFGTPEPLHDQPIERNVFGLHRLFSDAELAAMICPRPLAIGIGYGISWIPALPPQRGVTPGGTSKPERKRLLQTADAAKRPTGALPNWLTVSSEEEYDARHVFAASIGVPDLGPYPDGGQQYWLLESDENPFPDTKPAQKRLVSQLTEHTQKLVRDSEHTTRKAYWSAAPLAGKTPAGQWHAVLSGYRDRFEREHLGKFDEALLPPNAKTRKLFETEIVTGYGVKLDVFEGVPAYGILCLPKDLKAGERRPVVVCQHGLNGAPTDVSDPAVNNKSYNQFGLRLAERGHITFAPQNPYVLDERFRYLVRKANPLGYTLWSFIVPQHRQITDWLANQPFVDPDRIAFYGLSYGGKTAMRIPAVVDRYCLSICSGDFNEWTWKTTSLTFASGYPGTHEYEIFEWNLGNTFGYYEMAKLIAPRPFMVERGHRDGVAPDEWVAYEYAKVRRLYADLKIPERTTIEFFDGPHTIHGVGTFEFLDRFLESR